jgi:hypothetical protein
MPRLAAVQRVESPAMQEAARDAVIWGFDAAGRPFRPSDWSERLAGVTSAFGQERKVAYSPLVRPVTVGDARAVVVGATLRDLEPRLHQFLLQFARDNGLVVERIAGALDDPSSLVPPRPAGRDSTEPREPV